MADVRPTNEPRAHYQETMTNFAAAVINVARAVTAMLDEVQDDETDEAVGEWSGRVGLAVHDTLVEWLGEGEIAISVVTIEVLAQLLSDAGSGLRDKVASDEDGQR